MHKTLRRTTTAALTAGALVLPLAAPASAAELSEPVVAGLAGPLDLSVARNGAVYVAESFGGKVTRVARDGSTSTVVEDPGTFFAGVEAHRSAQQAYVASGGFEEGTPFAHLARISPNGRTRVLADLLAHEESTNPDGGVRYGFEGLTAECASQVPDYAGGGGYEGIVESNPYAVARVPGGWVVADAAGNSLVSVRSNGEVDTLAVLPRYSMVITQEILDAINAETAAHNAEAPAEDQMPPLPQCVAGHTHHFEAVPTDVELGPDGALYVSTLTGGPESPVLGPRSKVFRVDRRTGEVDEVARGLFAAVDLAVARDGSIYVAELFGGRISQVVGGAPQTVVELPLPGALEWADGQLHVAYDVFDQETGGKLATITL